MLCFLVTMMMGEFKEGNIQDLKFMTGQWVAEYSGGTFEETWSKPSGGTMVGHGRLLQGGKTSFMEFLSIETSADGAITMYIVLGALSKGEKKPALFQLTQIGLDSATFSREVDDFPQSIRYTKVSTGLECVLVGPGSDPKIERYSFKAAATR